MIVVTGGLGGAYTASALVELGHDVVVTAHHSTDVPSFLAGRVTVDTLDVRDKQAWRGQTLGLLQGWVTSDLWRV